jgi:hypothetical protein
VIGFSDATNTSQSKGETLKDTIKMVSNYVDMIVMRHPLEGSSRYASEVASVPVVNAGDGANQHPSQTLLDLYSILQTQGTLEGLTINMVGDLKYGRTTHSLLQAMSHFNPRFIFTAPEELKMPQEYKDFLDAKGIEYIETTSLDDYLNDCDSLYMTRVQQERFTDLMEYEKVKGIYDWICSNVTYDYDNLNNKDYYLMHSAYAALVHRKAVCQGFAVLFYRLALELGVDCRYITGNSSGVAHAWNIVRLGSLYYNLDATWDQPRKANGMDYEYFLRCGSNFPDHTRKEDYTSADFHQRYPMSPEDYGTDVAWPVSGTCGQDLRWELDAEGTLRITGSGNMLDFYAEDPQWQQYAYHIQKVIIGPEVQSVGAFAFYY